jgi:membrane protease YdiL (CAAX protease family)
LLASKKEYPEPIEALIVILLTFGIIFAALLIITVVALFLHKGEAMSGSAPAMFIFGGLFFLIIPISYAKLRQYNLRRVFRLNPVPLDITLIAFPIGLSLAVLTDVMDRIIRLFLPPPDIFMQYLDSLRAETSLDWLLLILGVVVIAAVSEEILFRGFLQISLEKKGDINRAVIMSSITWTLIHINPYWAIQIFVTGVIIGFLAWRTNSAYPTMIVHATNNFLSLLVINLNLEDSFDWYLWGDQVSPLISILAVVVLYLCIRYVTGRYQQKV